MSNITGVNGLVKVGANTIAEIVGFNLDRGANIIPDHNLNSTTETSKSGRTNWSVTIDVNFDVTDTTGQGAMAVGSTVALSLQPAGDTTGDITYTGNAIVESAGQAVADEAIVSQSFSLKGSGALTEGTVA